MPIGRAHVACNTEGTGRKPCFAPSPLCQTSRRCAIIIGTDGSVGRLSRQRILNRSVGIVTRTRDLRGAGVETRLELCFRGIGVSERPAPHVPCLAKGFGRSSRSDPNDQPCIRTVNRQHQLCIIAMCFTPGIVKFLGNAHIGGEGAARLQL